MTTPIVLDEDTYTDAISFIIERDFFPNLAKVKAQKNYLEAQQSGGLADLTQAGKALHELENRKAQKNENNQVNFYFEDEPFLEKRVNLTLSLDQFQTLYTSEDNSSFTELLEKTNEKRREQNKWFFDRESKQLRLTSQPDQESPIKLIETNELAPSGWKYKARNTLMYLPEGKSESWIDANDARAQPKAISHKNTDLPIELSIIKKINNLAPSDIQAARGGALTPWTQLNGVDATASASPSVRGYKLVDATPILSPSRIGTPEMTWGSIEGTPLLISGGETPGPRFSLPQISKREQLGMKLSEKASKAYRKKKANPRSIVQGTPRTGAGLMSPAAQHLFRKSQASPLTQSSGFNDALRSTYGASPLASRSPHSIRKPGSTPTPLFRAGATPLQHSITKKK
ncbi:hypothetical protein K501DRAFT_293758 [Backusella circina FSU 941]|nr:hypothetical protein K501DRAFT_293758 [Backusella circina FSU 941]